jgi:hypothetical protein
MLRRLSLLLVVGVSLVGCKTITEELPTAPSGSGGQPIVTVPFPVVVTPVTIPQPESPVPTPNPQTPNSPNPSPTPPDDGGDDDGEFIPDNQNAVAKVVAKVFFVECNGAPVPGSEGASTADVGCRVHLDVTPKDAGGRPTQPRGGPNWSYSDRSSFNIGGSNPFTPVLTVTKPGGTSISCSIDGVRSNDLSLRFR